MCSFFSLCSDWISKQCDEAILRKVIFQWCICEVAASSIMALNSLQHSLSLAPSNSNRTTTMPFHIVVAIIHKCLSHFYSPRCLCTAQLFNRKSSVRCAELCVSLCRSLKLLSLIKLICFFTCVFNARSSLLFECAILDSLASIFICSAGPFSSLVEIIKISM